MRELTRVLAVAATVLCWTSAAIGAEARRVALVIGNSIYLRVQPLANPVNDAKAIASALEGAGFDGVRVEVDLDAAGLRQALKQFAKDAAGAETALVYFAGHGVEVDGRNYLVPTDATLAEATDVEFEAVPLDAVRTAVSRASKLRLVILDACRNNPFKLETIGSSRSIGRGLSRVEPGSNELIVYAAKEGTVAADGDGANSPFAKALVRHLATPRLEINFLFRRVRDDVVAATNSMQEPFTYGTLGAEELFLNRAEEPASPSDSAAVVNTAAAWELVDESASIRVLEGFLAKYGSDPMFGPLAEERIAKLKSDAERLAAKGDDSKTEQAFLTTPKPLADFDISDTEIKSRVISIVTDSEVFWDQQFKQFNQAYKPPELVLYSDRVATPCGSGVLARGNIYCVRDQKVYFDFDGIKEVLPQADGNIKVALVYMIGRVVAGHVQKLLGVTEKIVKIKNEKGPNTDDARELTMRFSLQAECFTGLLAAGLDKEIRNALTTESELDSIFELDNKMQVGIANGTSLLRESAAQRRKWFGVGLEANDLTACDTFDDKKR